METSQGITGSWGSHIDQLWDSVKEAHAQISFWGSRYVQCANGDTLMLSELAKKMIFTPSYLDAVDGIPLEQRIKRVWALKRLEGFCSATDTLISRATTITRTFFYIYDFFGTQGRLKRRVVNAVGEAVKAVEAELARRQKCIENAVRPLVDRPKTFVGAIAALASKARAAIGSIFRVRPTNEQIETQANRWYLKAKLYAYTERALARYRWLRRMAGKNEIPLQKVDWQSGMAIVKKWHLDPTQGSEKDLPALFSSFQALEAANTKMQAALLIIEKKNESLQCALEILQGFDAFAKVQEKINVLAPMFDKELWVKDLWDEEGQKTYQHLLGRYSAITSFFTQSVRQMKKEFEKQLHPGATRGRISKKIRELCKLVKKGDGAVVNRVIGMEGDSVPGFLEMTGTWQFWIKARTGKDGQEDLQEHFFALSAEDQSLFIAKAILTGNCP